MTSVDLVHIFGSVKGEFRVFWIEICSPRGAIFGDPSAE